MSTPDPTIYNLIVAGQFAAASDALRAGWPQAMLDTLQVSSQRATAAYKATSGSSVTIGTGSKVFTLVDPRGWSNGTPVYIMETSNPSANYMVGKLSADEASGVVTVNVLATSGSGTHTDWTLIVLFTDQSIAVPPISIAQGGSGAVTAAGARTNYQVTRRFIVLGSRKTAPGSLSPGDAYRVLPSPGTPFTTHDNAIATWSGSAWSYEAPTDDGPLCIDLGNDRLLTWTGTRWVDVTAARPDNYQTVDLSGGGFAPIVTDLSGRDFVEATAGAGGLTLPTTSVPAGYILIFYNNSGSSNVVNVEGGGTIDGAALKTALNGEKWTFERAGTQWVVTAKV